MNRYLDFLGNIVGRTYEYSILLEYLHGIEFYSLVPNDDNRSADGEHLRYIFENEVGPSGAPSVPDGPCTVLEMLIGLSYRLEFELLGGQFERPAGDWFWVLIDNLGLDFADDIQFGRPETAMEVHNIVMKMLERRYDTAGNGGLFPIKKPSKDQRRVEIWYQMSAWVNEKYPI